MTENEKTISLKLQYYFKRVNKGHYALRQIEMNSKI